MYKVFLLLLIINISLNHIFPETLNIDSDKHVLLLNSYHKGFLWTDEITQGVVEIAKKNNFEIHVEYMDSKRQASPEYLELLLQVLEFKFLRHNYDVIITSDDNAFNFIIKNRDIFSEKTPVVFCGVNDIDRSYIEKIPNITGVNEEINIRSNIELIKQSDKFNKNIFIITDNSVTGKKLQQSIKKVIPLYNNIKIEYVYDLSMDELLLKTRSLSSDTSILLTLFFRDQNDDYFDNTQLMNLLSKNTLVPIYGTWDFNLNLGIIGGDLVSGYMQGVMAGEMCDRILKGERAEQIPIIYDTPTKYMFDYNMLKHFDITFDNLGSSEIINKPGSLYSDYTLEFWLSLTIFLLLILLLFLTNLGLQKLRVAHRELEYSSNQYRTLVNNLPGVTYRCKNDKNWTMEFIGEKIVELSGYSASDFIGNSVRSFSSIIYAQDRDYVEENIFNRLKEKLPFELEYRIVRKDGKVIWVYESGCGFIYKEGGYLAIDGLLLDITRRKAAEQELVIYKDHLEDIVDQRTKDLNISIENLKQAQNQLIQSEKMASLGSLIAGVAHEINTPLGVGVTSSSHLYLKTLELKKNFESGLLLKNQLNSYIEVAYESTELLQSSLNRAAEIVRSFKQISTDQIEEEIRSFEIREYIRDIIMSFYPRSELGNHSIICKEGTPIIVNGFPGVLSRILVSLISNSLSHGFKNVKAGIIKISISEKENDIILSFSDNGCGINEEIKNKVFEPFFTTNRKTGHIGLGLNITYNLVDQLLKGSIDCINNSSKGAEFIIRFPKNLSISGK